MAKATKKKVGSIKKEMKARKAKVNKQQGKIKKLKKAYPDREFYPASEAILCPDMKKITLGDIVYSLEHMAGQVTVPAPVREKALSAVQRMIDLA